mmetsp:Transcript_4532/g.7702  ORF Transcript_4532/g.7702 Transcript_4532/m.7702 type:complete len:115 (-) Transcript_4532:212-556(-)
MGRARAPSSWAAIPAALKHFYCFPVHVQDVGVGGSSSRAEPRLLHFDPTSAARSELRFLRKAVVLESLVAGDLRLAYDDLEPCVVLLHLSGHGAASRRLMVTFGRPEDCLVIRY